jgi:PAS domain S-box-containing protein
MIVRKTRLDGSNADLDSWTAELGGKAARAVWHRREILEDSLPDDDLFGPCRDCRRFGNSCYLRYLWTRDDPIPAFGFLTLQEGTALAEREQPRFGNIRLAKIWTAPYREIDKLIKRLLLNGYVVAVLSTALFLLFQLSLRPVFVEASSVSTFLAGVMLAAWFGGFNAGFFATVLSALVSTYFLIEPFHALQISAPRELLRVLLLMGTGSVLSLLIAYLHDQEKRALKRTTEPTEALRASEERFRLLVDGVRDYALFMLDPEGRIVSWNAGAERIKGWSADEAIGRHVSLFYTPEDIASGHPQRELGLAAAHGRYAEEGLRVRKDGSVFFAEVIITALRDGNGGLRGFAKVTRDITAQKQAKQQLAESHARLDSIVESAMDAIITINAQQRIVLFNAAAVKIFGCSAAEAIGESLHRFIPERFRDAHRAHVRMFQESGVTNRAMGRLGTLSALRASGEEFPIEASISQTEVGGQKLFTVILRDITERQQAEALRENDLRKNEFIAMLAHELRNPLAPIRNAALIIRKMDMAEPRLHWASEVIARQVSHVSRLVDELLDVSRIVQGKLTLQKTPLDLLTVIQQAVEIGEPKFEERHQTLTVSVPDEAIRFEGDIVRLTQALSNLLDNAAKYTPDGGKIWLTVKCDNGEAVISVRDNGEGIAPALLPHMFEVFTQAERTLDRSQGGLGLGLPIVQKIVELHRGRIEVRSKGVGQGSEFIVRLPLGEMAHSPDAGARQLDTRYG